MKGGAAEVRYGFSIAVHARWARWGGRLMKAHSKASLRVISITWKSRLFRHDRVSESPCRLQRLGLFSSWPVP